MSNSEEERMVSNMMMKGQRIPQNLVNKYALNSRLARAAKLSPMEKIAQRIKYSLPILYSNEYHRRRYWETPRNRWGPQFMNWDEMAKYGSFNSSDSLNTIKRKLQLIKNLKSSEKALLTRLYEPYYAGVGQNVRNNTKIKPVRNWYLGVLSKKYGVPKNWLNENPAINNSKAGKYMKHALAKKYQPREANESIAAKQLARKVSRAYVKTLETRIATAKKATQSLPSPIRKRIISQAFPGTRRHRSPNVGRTFN